MRVLTILVLLLITACQTCLAVEPEVTEWRWRCSSPMVYGMDIYPSSKSSSFGEQNTDNDQKYFEFVLKKKSTNDWLAAAKVDCNALYTLDVVQKGDHASLFDSLHDVCSTVVETRGKSSASELKSVAGVFGGYQPVSLKLSRTDTAWRFVIANMSLTTDKEARDLNLRPHQPGLNFEPKADVLAYTGECAEE